MKPAKPHMYQPRGWTLASIATYQITLVRGETPIRFTMDWVTGMVNCPGLIPFKAATLGIARDTIRSAMGDR